MQSVRKSPLYRQDLWPAAANDGYILKKYFLTFNCNTFNWTVHAEILRSGPGVEKCRKKKENTRDFAALNRTAQCINRNSICNASRKHVLPGASCELIQFPDSIIHPSPAHHALKAIESFVYDFVRNNSSLSAKPMFAQICDIYLHAIL